MLLEEPEMYLHPELVRNIPQMLARMQRRSGRQILISSHSPELIRDEGIGLDEILILEPGPEGTSIKTAESYPEMKALLHGGLSLADTVLPHTRPHLAHQLSLFGDR